MNKKKQKQLTVRMNDDLYNAAMWKCGRMGISLSNLVKIFLRSFVSQRGVGFYVGDDDLCNLFYKWLIKNKPSGKKKDPQRHYVGPYLKDLFDLNR